MESIVKSKFKVGDRVTAISNKRAFTTIIDIGEFTHTDKPGKVFEIKLIQDNFNYEIFEQIYGIDYHLSRVDRIRKLTKLERALK